MQQSSIEIERESRAYRVSEDAWLLSGGILSSPEVRIDPPVGRSSGRCLSWNGSWAN